MASGKTTFGRALAEKTGWQFLDLDEEIERQEGASPGDIMERQGEEAFRVAESRVLKQTANLRKTIIACGGGTPAYRDNMEFMTLHGKTLWLVASPGRIAERVEEAGATRPLLAGLHGEELTEFITRHLRSRQPHYFKADWRLSGEHLETQDEIEQTVRDFLALGLFNP